MPTHPDRHELLASLLRDLRIKAGLTQKEVATALDKPQSYVSKYESAERRLDLIELSDLSRVLGLDLPDLAAQYLERAK